MDRRLNNLCEKLNEKLAEYGDEVITAGNLDTIYKLSQTAKNLMKIKDESEYSERSYGNSRYSSYNNDSSYNDYGMGNSNARGRYSRADGKEQMMTKLRDMEMQTDDPQVKDALRRAMDMMR